MHAGREAYREFKKKCSTRRSKGIEIYGGARAPRHRADRKTVSPDPEVNHGIDNVINQQGMVVLTEDSVSGMAEFPRPIRILHQWVYHSRLYKAAVFAGQRDNLDVVQLNSSDAVWMR